MKLGKASVLSVALLAASASTTALGQTGASADATGSAR
jgi:hypothetical protein